MPSLFPKQSITFEIPDWKLLYYPSIFEEQEANELLELLKKDIPWQQDEITVYGKTHQQPRLTAHYGNDGKPYRYSSITMHPHKWNPLLTYIKDKVEEMSSQNYNTVLLNYYRDGKDSMGWHADDEKELGLNPSIASLSFGAERSFHLKHNTDEKQKIKINLEHGSLLLMQGKMQHYWKHQLPKTSVEIGPRINLTFRAMH